MGTRISQMKNMNDRPPSENNHLYESNVSFDTKKLYAPENKQFGDSFPGQPMRQAFVSGYYKVMTRNNSASPLFPVILPKLKVQGSTVDAPTTTLTNKPKLISRTTQVTEDIHFGKIPLINFNSNYNASYSRKPSTTEAHCSQRKSQDMFFGNPIHYHPGLQSLQNKQNKRSGSCQKKEIGPIKQDTRETQLNAKTINALDESVFRRERAQARSITCDYSTLPCIYTSDENKKLFKGSYERLREDIYWYSKSGQENPQVPIQESKHNLTNTTSDEENYSSSTFLRKYETGAIPKRKRKRSSNISLEELDSLRSLLKKLELGEQKMNDCCSNPKKTGLCGRKRRK